MSTAVWGIGTARPQHRITQAEAAELGKTLVWDREQARLLPVLYRRAQVQQRGSVLLEAASGARPRQSFYQPAAAPEDRGPSTAERMQRYAREASPLAVAAAHRALDQAGWSAGSITHLITVSCTGFCSPGVDVALIKQLGLPPTVGRVQVGFMGCHGALNGLAVAKAFADAQPAARVLLCSVELCSLHYHYGAESRKVVGNALFADGAAALLAGPVQQPAQGPGPGPDGQGRWTLAGTASWLLPDAEQQMSWQIGDHGFEMNLSPQVPELVSRRLRPWLEQQLGERGIGIDQVRSWAIHPGGPRILSTLEEALGLPPRATQASRQILSECGNMSSATVLFVIERLQQTGSRPPCVALGFGPGLVVEMALLL